MHTACRGMTQECSSAAFCGVRRRCFVGGRAPGVRLVCLDVHGCVSGWVPFVSSLPFGAGLLGGPVSDREVERIDLETAANPVKADEFGEMTADEMAVDGYCVLVGIARHKYKQGWSFLTLWD